MKLIQLVKLKGLSADALYLTIVRVITALSSIVCIKIVSVQFSLEEYGTYAQAVLIATTVTSVLILGMTDGVNYFFNRKSEGTQSRDSFIATIFILQFFLGVVGGAVILCSTNILTDYFENPQLQGLYIWIAFQPLLTNLLAMYQNLYISIGQARAIVVRNLILSIARVGIFIVAGYYTKSVITIVSSSFIFDLAQTLYFGCQIKRYGVSIEVKNIDLRKSGAILIYCVPMASFIIMNSLLRDMDKWIVGYFGSTEELAVYTNCSKVLPFDMLTISFATMMIPVITRLVAVSRTKVALIYGDYLNLSLITTAILVGPAIIYSKGLLMTLYDEKYLVGIYVFIIYLIIDLIRFANVSLLFSATAKTGSLIKISIFTLFVNAVLAAILYHLLGMTGPAVASFVSISVSYLLYLYGGSKILSYNIFKLFNLRKIGQVAAEIIIVGFFGLALKSMIGIQSPVLGFVIFYTASILLLFCLCRKSILSYMKSLNAIK